MAIGFIVKVHDTGMLETRRFLSYIVLDGGQDWERLDTELTIEPTT